MLTATDKRNGKNVKRKILHLFSLDSVPCTTLFKFTQKVFNLTASFTRQNFLEGIFKMLTMEHSREMDSKEDEM